MGLLLLGQQVTLRDMYLLLVGIAGQLDDLHAVEQRTRDGIGRIGGHDEQHTAQVDRDFQIVVTECMVLLRIEHFE